MTAPANETRITVNDLSGRVNHDIPDTLNLQNVSPADAAGRIAAHGTSSMRRAELRVIRPFLATAVAGFLVAILVMLAAPASAQTADPGADLYEQNCARCHQDDGLGLPGRYPPIAGNPDAADHDYVVIVVTDGLAGKEIMGVAYSSEMPAFGNRLTPEEIEQVATYTVQLSTTGPSSVTPSTVPTGVGSEAVGEELFIGSTLLAEGGTACVACHTAGEYDGLGGPTMAMSLNGIIDVYGKSGFIASITDPVVDPMIAVFEDHPISDGEANHLAAFLDTTSEDMNTGSSFDILAVVGTGGFLLLILITARVIRGPQDVYVKKLRSTR